MNYNYFFAFLMFVTLKKKIKVQFVADFFKTLNYNLIALLKRTILKTILKNNLEKNEFLNID